MKTLTEIMMTTTCPYNNPYQGPDKRVLFVCSAGLLRSATGARLYAKKYNTRACGSTSYALIPISDNLIVWADEIVFVNEENYLDVTDKYNLEKKKIVVLDIPDNYSHMAPELIQAFSNQYEGIDF